MFTLDRRIKVCSNVLKLDLRRKKKTKAEEKERLSKQSYVLKEEISSWKKTLGK